MIWGLVGDYVTDVRCGLMSEHSHMCRRTERMAGST